MSIDPASLTLLSSMDGLIWLILVLIPLIFLQRAMHREVQAIFLILTRHPGIAMALFALVFFPGVFIHEVSHFVAARLLRVRTGKFSLLPRATPDGHLQLGFVETAQADLLRDSIIGAAPLLAGGLFIAYAAIYQLELLPLWDFLRGGDLPAFQSGLLALPTRQDFPLWFYLTFAVSSTMLPSASDRHAWAPLGFFVAVLVGLALLAGAGPWMLENLAPGLNNFLRSVATVLGLSAVIQGLLLLPLAFLHRLLARITGLDIE